MQDVLKEVSESFCDLDALEAELAFFGVPAATVIGARPTVDRGTNRPTDPEPDNSAPIHFLIAAYAANK